MFLTIMTGKNAGQGKNKKNVINKNEVVALTCKALRLAVNKNYLLGGFLTRKGLS